MTGPDGADGTGPLQGLLVVDVSQFEAGPTCAQLLGLLGARVIKVERPGTGEPGRHVGPRLGPDESPMWQMLNAGKESVTIDLQHPGAADVVALLLARADVVVENFRPGVAERLGLGAAARRRYPRLVYVSITGFPPGSPWEGNPAFDPVVQAMGGITSLTGHPDGEPVRAGATVVDTATGWYGVVGALAALHRRAVTGRGAHVEVAMLDVAINLCRPMFGVVAAAGGARPERAGNGAQIAGPVPAGLFPCRPFGRDDRVSVLVAPFDGAWRAFVEAVGRPDLLDDPALATPALRYAQRERVHAVLAEWLAGRDKVEAEAVLAAHGVPAGAHRTLADLVNDPFLSGPGVLGAVIDHGGHAIRVPRAAVRIDGGTRAVTAGPRLGADTDRVLAGFGLGPDRLRELREQGVI